MIFGGVELSEEQIRLLQGLFRKPDFQDQLNKILDHALKFPIEACSSLEDQLLEVWAAWRRRQRVKPQEVQDFYARLILGLLAILINSNAEGAAELGKVLGLLFGLVGINKNVP